MNKICTLDDILEFSWRGRHAVLKFLKYVVEFKSKIVFNNFFVVLIEWPFFKLSQWFMVYC